MARTTLLLFSMLACFASPLASATPGDGKEKPAAIGNGGEQTLSLPILGKSKGEVSISMKNYWDADGVAHGPLLPFLERAEIVGVTRRKHYVAGVSDVAGGPPMRFFIVQAGPDRKPTGKIYVRMSKPR